MSAFFTWGLGTIALGLAAAFWRERRLRKQSWQHMRELAEKREAMRRCLEFLQEGVVLLGPRSEVLYMNPAAAGMLRMESSPPESGQHPVLQSLAPYPELKEFIEGTTPSASRREILTLLMPDSEQEQDEPEQVSLEMTIAAAGMARRLLVVRDVEAAEDVDRKRQDFVANASHELKTPIAALIGLLDLFDLVAEDKREDLLQRAQRNARGLANLADDLLALARAEAGEWQPNSQSLDVGDQIERVMEALRPAAEAKGLETRVAIAPSTSDLWLDDFALRTILQNLIGNAITYTEQGSITIRAELTPDQTRLHLEVSDTGPGIDPEIQPRIFERFFRADVAHSRETGGTGLGLSIVRHLVKRLGGRVSLHSEPGQGSTFRVELPCRL